MATKKIKKAVPTMKLGKPSARAPKLATASLTPKITKPKKLSAPKGKKPRVTSKLSNLLGGL